MTFRSVAVGCAFSLSLAACSEPVGFHGAGAPTFDPAAGKYALVSVDGHSVPTTAPSSLFTPEYECARHITSGKLTIAAQGRYALEVAVRELCTNGMAVEWTRTDSGTFKAGDAGDILFVQDATSDWHRAVLSARPGPETHIIVAVTSFGADVRFRLTE